MAGLQWTLNELTLGLTACIHGSSMHACVITECSYAYTCMDLAPAIGFVLWPMKCSVGCL